MRGGGKLLLCGNGGSAGDAQHLADRVRQHAHRRPPSRDAIPAIALTTDTSLLTAVANDFGFEGVFARQVEALGRQGDVLIGISTSGNSANVVAPFEQAQAARAADDRADRRVGRRASRRSPTSRSACRAAETSHIQEAHIAVGQLLAFLVEDELFPR